MTPSPFRRRLPQSCILVGAVLLLSLASARITRAQSDEFIAAPPIDVPDRAAPQGFIAPFNGDYTPYIESLPPSLRRGSCCVPSMFYDAGGCLSGIGLDPNLTDRQAFDICTDQNGIGGIHYNRGNLDRSQDETQGGTLPESYWACTEQCGQLLPTPAYYCDPKASYTCSTTPPSGSKTYQTPYESATSCETACVKPVTLQTTLGCACTTEESVLCTLTVMEDPASIPGGGAPSAFVLDSVDIRAFGQDVTLIGAFVEGVENDENGNRIRSDVAAGNPDDDATVLEFADPAGIRIPAGSARTGLRGSFRASVRLSAVAETGPMIVATAHRRGSDGVDGTDMDAVMIPDVDHCGEFTVYAQCDLPKDAVTAAAAPVLEHTYALVLPENGTGLPMTVAFSLDPGGSCLDLQTAKFPDEFCSRQRGSDTFTCVIPGSSATSVKPVSALAFTIRPFDDAVCPVGTPVPVTAIVTIGNEPPAQHDVSEAKIPCGTCDVCRYYQTEAECAAPADASGVPYCAWEYVRDPFSGAGGGGRCVSNDNNLACPVWYACCQRTATSTATSPQYSFLYAGRVGNGEYRPASRGAFPAADEDMFNRVQNECWNNPNPATTKYIIRWKPPLIPDERVADPAADPPTVNGDVAVNALRCSDIPPPMREEDDPVIDGVQTAVPLYCSYVFTSPPNFSAYTLTVPAPLQDCEDYVNPRTQPADKGTLYTKAAYKKTHAEVGILPNGIALLSCPNICDRVRNIGECFVPERNACVAGYVLQKCIADGGMFFTNDGFGQAACGGCIRDDGTNICSGPPPAAAGMPRAPKCGNGQCEPPWETVANCQVDCG